MGHLSLSDLLRNALPGGVFLIVLALGYPDIWPKISHATTDAASGSHGVFEATMLFALALLIGSTLYAAHRAVLYVLITRLLFWLLDREHRKLRFLFQIPFLFCVMRTEISDWRNKAGRATDKSKGEWFVNWQGRWADQTHFLWTSAWATFAAICLPTYFEVCETLAHGTILKSLAWFFLLCAVVDDLRHSQTFLKAHEIIGK